MSNNTTQDMDLNSQSENQNLISGMKDVAEGIVGYYWVCICSVLSPIFLIVLFFFAIGFFSIFIYNLDDAVNSGMISFLNGIALLGITVAIGFLNCWAMSYFCKTPKELYPNAKRTIIISFVLWLMVQAIYFLMNIVTTISENSDIGSEISIKAIELVLLGVSFYSYYSFYSFLNVIGEKTMEKGCKEAIYVLTLSFILFAINIFTGFPVFSFDSGNILSSAFTVTGDVYTYTIGYTLYAIGFIILCMHINNLRKYFGKSDNVKNGSTKEFSDFSWSVILCDSKMWYILVLVIIGALRVFVLRC